MKPSFYDLNYSDLALLINQNNLNDSAASVLFNWHYKKKQTAQCVDKIAQCSLAFFENNFDFSLPEIDTVHESKDDRTVKFLLSPWVPVKQKEQFMAQPTCEDRQIEYFL